MGHWMVIVRGPVFMIGRSSFPTPGNTLRPLSSAGSPGDSCRTCTEARAARSRRCVAVVLLHCAQPSCQSHAEDTHSQKVS